MAIVKSYSDISQSKTLSKILPLESADMCYANDGTAIKIDANPYNVRKRMWEGHVNVTPCWSLAALLSILPEIQGDKPVTSLYDNYITYVHMSDLHTKADNLVDSCYQMILKLEEKNLL